MIATYAAADPFHVLNACECRERRRQIWFPAWLASAKTEPLPARGQAARRVCRPLLNRADPGGQNVGKSGGRTGFDGIGLAHMVTTTSGITCLLFACGASG